MRKTSQKTAIRRAFDEDDRPLSPQEVLDAAREYVPGIGIATIYRSLKAFQDEGIIIPVSIPDGPPRYELAGKAHHHHFHCRYCGRVFDFHACSGDMKSITPSGFKLEEHEIVLYGRCKDCSSASKIKRAS